ncbi:MAG TPA: class I SAM-dependent methyltransferase [Tepidisphaeraceae bacterium]|nr:class I SAM-dependent methyltransferase [Tepidisphaeraceae bacterium]
MNRKAHWENVYTTKDPAQVSWYQPDPTISMRLIESACPEHGRIIDVGGGTSFLVDRLLDAGFKRIAVLDISLAALQRAKARLGERAGSVQWLAADVTAVDSVGRFGVWHDRAVFHFLTDPEDRRKYVGLATRTVPPGGHLVIGTFALDGPARCSGLEVQRHDAGSLSSEFGSAFRVMHQESEIHVTPSGESQPFNFVVFARQREIPTVP